MSRIKHAPGSMGPECGETSFCFPQDFAITTDEVVTCLPCRAALVGTGNCPGCGSRHLTWSVGTVQGTISLGCQECCEKVIVRVDLDVVAGYLTSVGWRPGSTA
jgi:hypothetical protein